MSLVTRRTATLALASLAFAGRAGARPATVPLVDLLPPGGLLGTNGFDLFREQAVAQRFTVPEDGEFRLARIGLYLMNNSDTEQHFVRVQVRLDALDTGGLESMPGKRTIEQWTARVETLGWSPVEQFFRSEKAPRLQPGKNYWVVAGSRSAAFTDPVWCFSRNGNEVGSQNHGTGWSPGFPGGALTLRVDAFTD